MEIEVKGGEGEPKPIIDTFGTERNTDGTPVVPTPPADKKKEGEGKKDDEDFEKNPVVVQLRDTIKKLEEDKGSMGGNLSAQGKAIEKMKQELADLKSGKSSGVEPLFKDIKRVKDLPAEQQAEMTDAEKKIFDELADTHEAMNKLVADAAKKESDAEAEEATAQEAEDAAEAFNGKVQSATLALVGVTDGRPTQAQKDMANAIIEEFNAFAGNEKLSDKELAERIQKAAKLVPDYKPAKEQKSPAGAAAKPVDQSGSSEVDKIVEETRAGQKGGTYTL